MFLDAEQKGVVHDIKTAKERCISIDLLLEEGSIAHEQAHEVLFLLTLQLDEVHVLQGLLPTVITLDFHLAVDSAALEIENSFNFARIFDLHGVCHKHEMNRTESSYFHSEHAVDTGE